MSITKEDLQTELKDLRDAIFELREKYHKSAIDTRKTLRNMGSLKANDPDIEKKLEYAMLYIFQKVMTRVAQDLGELP